MKRKVLRQRQGWYDHATRVELVHVGLQGGLLCLQVPQRLLRQHRGVQTVQPFARDHEQWSWGGRHAGTIYERALILEPWTIYHFTQITLLCTKCIIPEMTHAHSFHT